jgi:hypothetical protein
MIVSTIGSDLVAEVAKRLQRYGASGQQYLTGSFAGASPLVREADIVFQPNAGPHSENAHVVEFKFVRSSFMPDVTVFGAVRALREVQARNPTLPVRAAFATNASLFPVGRRFCEENGVTLIERVADADDLTQRIVRWAGIVAPTFGSG